MPSVDRDHRRFRAAYHNLPGPVAWNYVKNRMNSPVTAGAG